MDKVRDTFETNVGAEESADLVYWIWLSLAIGAGSSAAGKLFSRFGQNVRAIYDADPAEYVGLPKGAAEHLTDKSLRAAVGIYNWCSDNGVGMLPYDSEYFPPQLRNIPSPPVMLYYLGLLPNIKNRFSVAIVGTRRISQYGARNAYTISSDLASAGTVIVSGMALGVDGVAHGAALDVDGYTIAVLGCGIDRVYPREHKNLYGEIIRRGTVLTEFCPGAAPIAHNFPIRNRIISGMSTATVVIEADERSGALITAKDAKRQGRAVYALPGNVGALGSSGTNKLLLEGAKMVTSALDILDDYKDEYAKVLNIENVTGKLARFDGSFNLRNTYGRSAEPCYPRLGSKGESRGGPRRRQVEEKLPKPFRADSCGTAAVTVDRIPSEPRRASVGTDERTEEAGHVGAFAEIDRAGEYLTDDRRTDSGRADAGRTADIQNSPAEESLYGEYAADIQTGYGDIEQSLYGEHMPKPSGGEATGSNQDSACTGRSRARPRQNKNAAGQNAPAERKRGGTVPVGANFATSGRCTGEATQETQSVEQLLAETSECGRKIYALIPETGTTPIDEIVRHDLSFPFVMAGLTELEISGLAVLGPGGEYRRGEGF